MNNPFPPTQFEVVAGERGDIKLVRRDHTRDVWAIQKNSLVWNKMEHGWEYEPLPSSRTEQFFVECRMTLNEAVWIAEVNLANWTAEMKKNA